MKYLRTLYETLLGHAIPGFGANRGRRFYVDATGGNDSNSGLAPGQAWQTITKVNAFTNYRPGDKVLFKRGETWTLAAAGDYINCISGITYTDYGTGNIPIIDGNNAATVFYANAKNNITIKNIDIRNGLDSCVQANNSAFINVINCNTIHAGNDNIVFINGCHDCRVSGGVHANPYRRVADGRLVTCIEIADGGYNFWVQDTECYGSFAVGIEVHNHTGYDIPTNVTIENNYCHDNGASGIQILCMDQSAAALISILENICTNNSVDGIRVDQTGSYYASGYILIDQNTLDGNTSDGVFAKGDNVYVHRNIVINPDTSSYGIRFVSAKNCNAYNNSIYAVNAIVMLAVHGGARVDTINFKNNICSLFASNATTMVNVAALSGTNVVFDYNEYNFPSYAGNARWQWLGVSKTFANWLLVPQDTHGLGPTSNPLFVNPPSDLHLQAGSPAINAGVDVGLPFLGVAPDIGAYEKQ